MQNYFVTDVLFIIILQIFTINDKLVGKLICRMLLTICFTIFIPGEEITQKLTKESIILSSIVSYASTISNPLLVSYKIKAHYVFRY